MFLGLSWIAWVAIAINFGAAFINTWFAQRWRQRITQSAKTTAFALAVANAPEGAVSEELRALARSVIPPDAMAMLISLSPSERVH